MGAWDTYKSRMLAKGGSTLREARVEREKQFINRKLPDSLSYTTVEINGVEQEAAILNSDDYSLKTLISMPGEDIDCGSLVLWKDIHWLVTLRDPNNEVYTKTTMERCNYLLKWIHEGEIVERWCIVADGTKYLTGETSSSHSDNALALGDTRISVTLARDEITAKLNRSYRFLIDDYGTDSVLAYRLTKPFKLTGVYDEQGVMTFVLSEVNTEDDDNLDLHIADYYKHFPREDGTQYADPDETDPPKEPTEEGGKRVWL